MRGQNSLLEKYDLKPHDEDAITSKIEGLDSSVLDSLRKKLTGIEGKFSEGYFKQVFSLLPARAGVFYQLMTISARSNL